MAAILDIRTEKLSKSEFPCHPDASHQVSMWFEEFHIGYHGSHLGYWNRTILVILNLHHIPMPPIKFQPNPTYGLRDISWRMLRRLQWQSSWISERNEFSNAKSPCRPNASTNFQLDLTLRLGADVVWRFSRLPPWWPSWVSERNDFNNSKSLCSPMPSTKFLFSPTYHSGAEKNWRFSRWPPWRPSWTA